MSAFNTQMTAIRSTSVGAVRAITRPAPFRNHGRVNLMVRARNFKTRETEESLSRNTPDAEDLNAKLQEFTDQLKAKWDETDEKPAVVAVGVSAFIALWALSGLVDRLDKLPLVGGFLELIGLLVTGWFTYRYLTFAPDRDELKKSASDFYQKVTGKKTW